MVGLQHCALLNYAYLLEGYKLGSMFNLCQTARTNTGYNVGVERMFFIEDQQRMVTHFSQIL